MSKDKMKKIFSFLLLISLALTSHLASATAVSGTILNGAGAIQPLGTVVFTAKGCPAAQMTIISTGAIATASYTFTSNSSAVWSGTVLGNDKLICPGSGATQYLESEYSASGQLLSSRLFTLVDATPFTPSTLGSSVVPKQGFLTNPLAAQGDILMGGVNGVPTRLPIGPEGYCFISNGTIPVWSTGCGGGSTGLGGTPNQVVATDPSGSSNHPVVVRALVDADLPNSTVTPGTYLNVAFTVNSKGLITAAGTPFSASFGCTQCGTYEIGYSGITVASGAISYANPSVPTSASVSDGTNTDTLSTPFTSWVLSHTYTTNTTFTLTTLGNGQTVTQSNGIAFVPRSYGGTGSGGATGATASGTSAALVGASGTLTNIGLGSSCAGQSFTATTSGTQYIYYLSPCNVSNPGGGSFTIPGPTVFPMNAPTSFTFTGQYGGTWTGYLYQSVNSYVNGTSYTIGVGN
jgi:hypothetical protein